MESDGDEQSAPSNNLPPTIPEDAAVETGLENLASKIPERNRLSIDGVNIGPVVFDVESIERGNCRGRTVAFTKTISH